MSRQNRGEFPAEADVQIAQDGLGTVDLLSKTTSDGLRAHPCCLGRLESTPLRLRLRPRLPNAARATILNRPLSTSPQLSPPKRDTECPSFSHWSLLSTFCTPGIRPPRIPCLIV